MKKRLLVLIFDEDSLHLHADPAYVFNNELDAESFLSEIGLTNIKIQSEHQFFSFKTPATWKGSGKAIWVTSNI